MHAQPYALYMILDISSAALKVLHITDGRRINHREYLEIADGKKVVILPLEARSLSKFDQLSLQYLHYGLLHIVPPPDDYGQLIQECFEAIKKLPTDTESLDSLIKRAGATWVEKAGKGEVQPIVATGMAQPVIAPDTRVKTPRIRVEGPQASMKPAKGVTAQVWDIADEMYQANGNKIPDRKALIEACTTKGINEATAGTQFAKWKKSKGI